MRERFRDWGAGLSDAEFACALAAGGVVARTADPDWDAERLAEEIGRQLQGTFSKRVVWNLDEGLLRLDARILARAWNLFRDELGRGTFRIELHFRLPGDVLFWAYHQLSSPHIGAESVYQGGRSNDLQRMLVRKGLEGTLSIPAEPEPDRGKTGYAAEAGEDEATARYLQARMAPPVRPVFEYRVFVRIGLPDRRYASVEKPFPSLSETETHELTVIFWEPSVSPDPQIQILKLPPQGNSSEVRFAFPQAEAPKSIAARITVIHNNRVLQTGLLRATLPELSSTFELDATPRTRLEGLGSRTPFDAALVLDRESGMTAASGGQAVVLDIDNGDIQKLTRLLGRKISEIADDPDRYKKLESPGSVELLRELAQKGARVHHHLCTYSGLSDLSAARRIHITSARAESFFPAELLYVHRPPSDEAKLCPHAGKALEAGDCTGDCPSDKAKTVCPLGFWGLSKVIERHAHKPQDRKGGDVELRSEPVRERSLLPISGTALLAASSKVSEFKKDAVTRLLKKLEARGEAVLATTWKEWTNHVKSKRPRLLVLLPHHDRDDDGDEFLEIGGDPMETGQIWDEQVRVPKGPDPVVLLMGCETNLADISFETPAIVFKSHGAAVVVTTIASILGRHASPATEELIQLLDDMADGRHTFGDILLRLRQKLVATSTPMALGLTSYGDADWFLTRETDARDRDVRRPVQRRR